MAFTTRLKRWKNKTTGGATAPDYNLNEVNMNNMMDTIERMISVINDVFQDVVLSGGLEANRTGLQNDVTACVAYAKSNRVQQSAGVVGHVYTALKDTYVHLNTTNGEYSFNEVANLATAPTVASTDIAIMKVVTDATAITGVTDLANRSLKTVTNLTISDTSLATISTAGKVSDTALSTNVALKDVANAFTQNQAINVLGGTMSMGTSNEVAIFQDPTGSFNELLYQASNATKTAGGVWNRTNIAKKAALIGLSPEQTEPFQVYYVASGANPISWTQILGIDSTGKMTVGSVPAERITSGTLPSPVIVPLARLSAAAANSGYPQSGAGAEVLRILRGGIGSDGFVSIGGGFTSVRNSLGNYTITFGTSFSAVPSVVATPFNPAASMARITSITTGSVGIITSNGIGGLFDTMFDFVVVGPA